jgi:DNA-binding NtrC family response regulator
MSIGVPQSMVARVVSEVLMDGVGQKSSPLALSAVIVEPELSDALMAVSALSAAGFHVTVAEGFSEARALLTSYRHSLLISGMQLWEHNGLHLVLHGKAIRPDMAAVITTRRPDPALENEAVRMGATVVAMPTTEAELLAAVVRTIMRAPGDTTPISARFERRTRERRAPRLDAPVTTEQRQGERRRGLARLIDPVTAI